MARRKNEEESFYMIATRPLDQDGYGRNGNFYNEQGERVKDKLEGARFSARDYAEEFAKRKGIKLDSAIPYIDKVLFTESELQRLCGKPCSDYLGS